jgi:hypothetical protein
MIRTPSDIYIRMLKCVAHDYVKLGRSHLQLRLSRLGYVMASVIATGPKGRGFKTGRLDFQR